MAAVHDRAAISTSSCSAGTAAATPQRPSTPCSASARAADPPTTATSSDNAADPGRPGASHCPPSDPPQSGPNTGPQLLAESITDLFGGESRSISDRERVLMYEIMHQMVLDTEMSVRKIVAARLAEAPGAPPDLVKMLANDDIEVAFPILTQTDVLKDSDLIEIIQQRALEHQLAISIRSEVSEEVSDAVVEKGDENVILNLLRNSGARISSSTMEYLVGPTSCEHWLCRRRSSTGR